MVASCSMSFKINLPNLSDHPDHCKAATKEDSFPGTKIFLKYFIILSLYHVLNK